MQEKIISFFKEIFNSDLLEIRIGEFPVIILKNKYPSQVIKFQNNLKKYKKIIKENKKNINKTKNSSFNAYPLFLSEEFILNAQDSFPVDIFFIKHFTKNIFGKDTFISINPDKKYLRLNCERELRNKLFRITNQIAYVKNLSESVKLILSIIRDLKPVLSTLRNIVTNEYEIDSLKNYKFFIDYLDIKNGNKIIETITDISKLQSWGYIDFLNIFYETIEKLTQFVDQHFSKYMEI